MLQYPLSVYREKSFESPAEYMLVRGIGKMTQHAHAWLTVEVAVVKCCKEVDMGDYHVG